MAAGNNDDRKQRQLMESETNGNWIERVRLMESGGEWGSLIAERARESVE